MPRTKKSVSVETPATATANQVSQRTYLEIRKESQQDRDERVLQYEVKDNLNNLMADIEATQRKLDNVLRSREELMCVPNVDWNRIVSADKDIEAYRAGLDRLKNYRNTYFPNWRDLVVQD